VSWESQSAGASKAAMHPSRAAVSALLRAFIVNGLVLERRAKINIDDGHG
jgi:hypothetical protein